MLVLVLMPVREIHNGGLKQVGVSLVGGGVI